MSDKQNDQPDKTAEGDGKKTSLYGSISQVVGISAPGEGRSTPKVDPAELEKLRDRQVEPDDLPVGILFGIVAVLTVVVAVVAIFITQFFAFEAQRQVFVKDLSVVDERIVETQKIDAENMERIKIDNVIKDVAKNPALLLPFGPQAVTPPVPELEPVGEAESAASGLTADGHDALKSVGSPSDDAATTADAADTSDSKTESHDADASSDSEKHDGAA